jgi:hypothetical protein
MVCPFFYLEQTMKNNTLQNAFPIVAAAIGNRLGIKVSVGGNQAYTDGKTIQLPAYDGDDPDYQDFAWGLLAHEAAHIRYSDFSLHFGGSVLRRRLCGAIEDVRIEHELAKDFPGTRLTLRTVVDKMIANGSFIAASIDDHPANILYGYVLKSLRARVLGQVSLNPLVELTEVVLNTCFPKGAIIRLKGLLSEVPDGLHSEGDCLALADRILAMIKVECTQHPPRGQQANSSVLANDNGADNDNSSEATDGSEQGGDAGELDPSESLENPQDEHIPNQQAFIQALMEATESDLAADVFDTLKSELALETNNATEVLMPIAFDPMHRDAAGLALLQKVQAESGKIRAALQGLVQSQTLNRSRPSSRGRLNGQRLYRLGQGDPKVFLRRMLKAWPNTAIHLLLDKSDSMGYQVASTQGHAMGSLLPVALESTVALALALEGLPGVNSGITAFPGNQAGSVFRLLEHGQRVRQRAGAFALWADGSTPMTEAIWFAAAALLQCREPRKVLIVMTDGQPDDTVSTLEIIERCRDSGIETVGIGLGIEVSHLFPVAIVINDLQELRTQLFELSKSLLLAV